jgi:hypothetical protein
LHDPNEPILPWNSKNTPVLKTRDDEQVIQWQKTTKPNSKDYKAVFKDEAYCWARAKESFLGTIESHGLQDLVEDPAGFVPDNKELDEKKRKWLSCKSSKYQSSGLRWHKRFADVLRSSMGFFPLPIQSRK